MASQPVVLGGSWDQLTAAAGDSFTALQARMAAAAAAALAPTAADGQAAVTAALLGRHFHQHSPSPAPPYPPHPPSPGGSGGVLSLSPVAVALAAALIVVQALVSLRFSLGLHTQLAVAAARCVVQLSVLGYVLGESDAMAWTACDGDDKGGTGRGGLCMLVSLHE